MPSDPWVCEGGKSDGGVGGDGDFGGSDIDAGRIFLFEKPDELICRKKTDLRP